MPTVTVVTTCKGRLHHLQESLPRMVAQSDTACIVVDYGCPDGTSVWVRKNHPEVKVVHVTGAKDFNVCKARNIGAAAVNTPWICFVDADSLLAPDFIQNVLPQLRERTFYLTDSFVPELVGLVICSAKDFAAIGGFDETFCGWGCEDDDLYIRLAMSGCTKGDFPSSAATVIHHDEPQSTRFHEISDRWLSLRINGMYFQIKTDLARQAGGCSCRQRKGSKFMRKLNVLCSRILLPPPTWRSFCSRIWISNFLPAGS